MHWSMPRAVLRRRATLVAALHLGAATAAYAAAYGLRFDLRVPAEEGRRFVETLPLLLVARWGAVYALAVHRGSWRHVGLRDLGRLLIAATVGSAGFAVLLAVLGQLAHTPRSVLLIDWIVFLLFAAGMRVTVRGVRENAFRRPVRGGRRVLVIGAGQAGERFVRQIQHEGRADVSVIGFLDDAPSIQGLVLHGIPVLGTVDALASTVRRKQADLVVIATPSASGEQMRRIVARCSETRLEYKTVFSGRETDDAFDPTLLPLRAVELEDLLGRPPVRLTLDHVQRDLAGRTVLITGGAGSIGSELGRQIAKLAPSRVVIFDRAESPLYFAHLELTAAYPDVDVIAALGDVTDVARLDGIVGRYRPDYVFHAAAYKHVPLCEAHVREAVHNNVLGTYRVAECAARHGVRKMVLISTDKAVNPSSVMGATKRLAERLVLHTPEFCAARTEYRVVRFGNVLGSDGSVVPLFRRQLASGGPLTVTHPDVTRYFMSIPEAVQLVLQAAAVPEASGRVAMLEMGEPVRILDLAEQLIRMSGRVPHRDVQIVVTGLRPGEKLTEELVRTTDAIRRTSVDQVYVVDTDSTSDGSPGRRSDALFDALFDALACGDDASIHAALHAAVPEYAEYHASAARPSPASAPHEANAWTPGMPMVDPPSSRTQTGIARAALGVPQPAIPAA